MRTTGAAILILFYFIGMLKPIQPYLEYELRKDYILEFLCVNKDKPITRCNGNCFLNKRIISHQAESSSNVQFFNVNMDDYPIGFIAFVQIPNEDFMEKSKFGLALNHACEGRYMADVFRPPIFT